MKYISTHPDFYSSLREEVKNYFKDNSIDEHGNWRLYFKTTILLSSFFLLLIAPYVITMDTTIHYLTYALLGIDIAFIGFNIGHDAVHGSFSKNSKTNVLFSYAFELVGVSHYFWKYKHDIAHHTYTNVNGMDDDIETGKIFRFNKEQKWYWWHVFQTIYAIPIYSLLYFQWVFIKDIQKWITMKVGSTTIKEMNREQVVTIILSKLFHITVFWFVPCFVFGFPHTLYVNMAMYIICGIVITVTFQLAHVQNKSNFPIPDRATGNINNDWAISQIQTTANFATHNPIVTELTGGLNHQIEHHLFSNYSHIHYPAIRKIVKQKCIEFSNSTGYVIKYNEYRTTIEGFIDHMRFLGRMSMKS